MEHERIEEKSIDSNTKRIWLTNNPLREMHLGDAEDLVITTELTMSGMAGTSLH